MARDDRVARLHINVALAFLAVGSVLIALAAARLVVPDTLTGVDFLAYGRLLPVAFNLFVYGWLTIGLIGAGYYIIPRVSGKELRRPGAAVAGVVLLTVGFLGGAVGVALGGNEGRQYLESPLWADAVVLLGLLAVVLVFTSTIAQSGDAPLAPSEWFFGSAPIWLLLSHIVGNIPGLTGVNSVLQTTFYRGALFGLWFAAAGVGVVYFLASSLAGRDPRRVTQLSVAGFWSLAFVFALSGGSRLTYTAAPDWVETIGGVFSIALFLPVAIILVDVATTLRGSRSENGGTALRFLVAGAVGFAIVPVVNLALSVRSSSAIVGLTDWVTGLDTLVLFGVFSFWLFGFIHHTSIRSGRGRVHFAVSVVAVLAAVGTMLVSGVQAGLTWVAAANSGQVAAGEGFESTAGAVDGHQWVRFSAFALFALAQLWLLAAARFGSEGQAAAESSAADPEPDESADDEATDDLGGLPAGIPVTLGKLRTGAIGVFVMVAMFAFGFPALEAEHVDGSVLADEVRTYDAKDEVAAGRAVYLAEGCWYCHTQEVRGIVTDIGLGPVALAGDYSKEAPSTAGVIRVGPDLMFAGSRDVTKAWVETFLGDPRTARPWSTMPAHDYLGESDMSAVAAYIAGLRHFEFE
jgi:cbb3-type cytochrome oxidase subunit 1/mono/diheme cytochrome c family protein